ncbi:hypothetical protein [Xenophilus azovorans]|uniref:hypothetical protein n=1 Tax=Xenophilus azovorans TaxID=151755 RepID=UPI0012EDA0D7|nr:hypothetical protein [Xenophilus azovorans]
MASPNNNKTRLSCALQTARWAVRAAAGWAALMLVVNYSHELFAAINAVSNAVTYLLSGGGFWHTYVLAAACSLTSCYLTCRSRAFEDGRKAFQASGRATVVAILAVLLCFGMCLGYADQIAIGSDCREEWADSGFLIPEQIRRRVCESYKVQADMLIATIIAAIFTVVTFISALSSLGPSSYKLDYEAERQPGSAD